MTIQLSYVHVNVHILYKCEIKYCNIFECIVKPVMRDPYDERLALNERVLLQ